MCSLKTPSLKLLLSIQRQATTEDMIQEFRIPRCAFCKGGSTDKDLLLIANKQKENNYYPLTLEANALRVFLIVARLDFRWSYQPVAQYATVFDSKRKQFSS